MQKVSGRELYLVVSHPGSMNSNKNTTKRGTSPLEVGANLYVNVWGDIRVISVLILMFYPLLNFLVRP